MTTGETKLLFSWDDVDSLPDMRRLRLVLDWLPDGPVIEALRARRGRGRDDYPVDAMWRALVAGVVFQHASMESLLRELGRNPGLLSVCGFDPLPRQGKPRRAVRTHRRTGAATVVEFPSPARSPVPNAWNFSRFMESLERIDARLDNDFGFERHYIRGHAAMKTRVGLALAIMMALALGHVLEGRAGRMRSLVAPIPFQDSG